MVNFCNKCGAALINNPNYCTRCGTKVDKEDLNISDDNSNTSKIYFHPQTTNEIIEQTSTAKTNSQYGFHILSFLALILFSFIAYEAYQFMKELRFFEAEYKAGNYILNFFVRLIKRESNLNEEQIISVYEHLKNFGYLFLGTNALKAFFAFLNSFVQKRAFPNCISIIFFIEVVFAAILIGVNPFEDYCKVVIVLAVPNLIGYWLMRIGQEK